MQRGVGAMGLRFVRRRRCHRLGRFASAWRACPWALRVGCGALLALRLGFRFGLGLSPLPSGCKRGAARRTARPLSGERIASTAPQRRVFRFVLLRGRRDEGRKRCAPALHCLVPLPVTHGLVPRRMALDCRALGRHVAQLSQTCCARQAHHLHNHLFAGIQMLN